MKGSLSVLFICLAVMAAAVAAVWVSNNRAAEARAYAEAEAAAADAKEAEAREAAKAAEAEADKRRTAESNAKAAKDRLEAQRLATQEARDKRQAEAETKALKQAEAKIAEEKADAAVAEAEAEQAKASAARAAADQAQSEAAAARDRAQARADELAIEQSRSERAVAEAKTLELLKLDLETMQRELLDFKRELDERELELRPEKTIKDLVWLGDDDTEVLEDGTVRKREKPPYLAENDPRLLEGARKLAKAERLVREDTGRQAQEMRERLVRPLERMYAKALREGRRIDADYYAQNLKSMYPDWEPDAKALAAAVGSGEKNQDEKKESTK